MAKTKATKAKTKKAQPRKLRWLEGKLPSGPGAGTVWGAKSAGMFLLIVHRPATDNAAPYYELWSDGVIHDETHSPTLAAAKAFAERSLPAILSAAQKAA
jgi:hypothetical protein